MQLAKRTGLVRTAVRAVIACAAIGTAGAQEIEHTTTKAVTSAPATAVTQEQLSAAASDSQQLPAYQRQLRSDALFPRQADRHHECRQAASGVDLPDGSEGVAGDDADRRQWRHVRDDGLQSRLCAQRQDRRAVLALQAQDGSDHDLLLRPQQSRRRGERRQGLHGDARRQAVWRSMPRPAASSGRRRSPILNSATARRWRRRRSTARSSSAPTAASTASADSCAPTTPRPASRCGTSTPSPKSRRACGRHTMPPDATCIATSQLRRPPTRNWAIPTRRSAAAFGRTRRSI